MHLSTTLIDFADKHHGLVTLDAWKAAGGSARSFERARQTDVLPPVCRHVSALPGRSVGTFERIAAGVLYLGRDRVVVSHRSAAWLWGAEVAGAKPVHLLAVTGSHRTELDDYVVHRPRSPGLVKVREQRELPVTSPLRTLFDLAAIADVAELVRVMEAFLVAGLVSLGMIESTLVRYRRRGRRGMRRMDRALAEVRVGVGVPDSVLESKAAKVFRRAGLGDWEFHAIVHGYEVDFAFPAERVVVEVDGWAVHGAARRRWEGGLERDLVIQSGGWLVVHLGWRMITQHPDRTGDRLRHTIESRRRAS